MVQNVKPKLNRLSNKDEGVLNEKEKYNSTFSPKNHDRGRGTKYFYWIVIAIEKNDI